MAPESAPFADASAADGADEPADSSASTEEPEDTIEAAAAAIVDSEPDTVRLLDDDAHQLVDTSRDGFADLLEDHEACQTVLVNGPITQMELDVAARHDVETIVGHRVEHVVKRPIRVHVVTFAELDVSPVDA